MSELALKKVHRAEVASHIPGRLRIRLHRQSRDPRMINGIKDRLAKRPGIHGVEVNQTVGSITVHYDHHRYKQSGIFAVLEDLDVVLGTLMDAPSIEGDSDGSGQNATGVTFADALSDLDRRIHDVPASWLI